MNSLALPCLLLSLSFANTPMAAEVPAERVVCHVGYGGQTEDLAAAPTLDPYRVAAVPVGSHFLFRIVFRREPLDLAGIKLHAYALGDAGAQPIHQASYRYPPAHAGADGFTGRQFVYEPGLGAELQYWCELQSGAAK